MHAHHSLRPTDSICLARFLQAPASPVEQPFARLTEPLAAAPHFASSAGREVRYLVASIMHLKLPLVAGQKQVQPTPKHLPIALTPPQHWPVTQHSSRTQQHSEQVVGSRVVLQHQELFG